MSIRCCCVRPLAKCICKKGSWDAGSNFHCLVDNYVIVDMILVEKGSPMYGCGNLESVELKTSFGVMSLGELVELETTAAGRSLRLKRRQTQNCGEPSCDVVQLHNTICV